MNVEFKFACLNRNLVPSCQPRIIVEFFWKLIATSIILNYHNRQNIFEGNHVFCVVWCFWFYSLLRPRLARWISFPWLWVFWVVCRSRTYPQRTLCYTCIQSPMLPCRTEKLKMARVLELLLLPLIRRTSTPSLYLSIDVTWYCFWKTISLHNPQLLSHEPATVSHG